MTDEHAAELEAVRDAWQRFGELDPLYAILTPDDKRLGGWDTAEFFATGETEINEALAFVASAGVEIERGRALDFGCGVGRLTQALCRHFEACVGIDIAVSMIEGARRFNRFAARVEYVSSDSPTLPFNAAMFDFVYSRLVLQHIPPSLALGYVGELLRVTRPGGVALLQTTIGIAPQGTAPHLTADGCAAAITVDVPPTTVRASEKFVVECSVENRGTEAWRSVGFHQVRLGNHWLTAEGEVAVRDDGRAMFPRDLEPGENVTLQLSVTAPARAGHYVLELDVVEEAMAWFADRGSPTLRISVRVRRPPILPHRVARIAMPATRTTAEPTTYDIPPVHVYWVDEDELRSVIAAAGAHVVAEREDPSVSGYVSKQYCVVRS